MLQLLFLLTCPLLVALAVAFLTWNALAGPWKFLLASTATLYALYAASFYLFAPASVGFAIHAVEPGQPAEPTPLFVYLEPYYKPLLIFALAALPALLLLLKAFKR
jgi:hypothetical protein